MSNKKQQPKGRSHAFALIAVTVSVVLAGWLLLHRQLVVDQVSFWQYQPSSQMAALAARATMSGSGKFYFYASRPALEEAQAFNKQCDRKEQGTAVLGCYTGRFIYIYDVSNQKLDGIREVTASHEMLHAAYDRLDTAERKKIDALLEVEYSSLKNDKKLAERMAFYSRTEPGERDNELHSVIGTEIGSISPELESYYKRYFTDRHQVVELHDKYESLFTDLQSRGEALSSRLTQLASDIEAESVEYNKSVVQLNTDIAAFNGKARQGGFASAAEFQAARSSLVTRANQLEQQRIVINNKITEYSRLRQELLSIASQSEALNRSIDSSLAPAPSL